MPSLGHAPAGLPALLAALLAGLAPAAAAAAEVVPPTAGADAGFELVVVGSPPDVDHAQFLEAVRGALPTALVDPQSNFTRDPAFQRDETYRMVLVFHGDDVLDPGSLCTRFQEVQPPPPPSPSDLAAKTQVTAAFCAGANPVSQGKGRMIGSVKPGQAGFKFLVADVAKQLFPDGFNAVPGTVSAAAPARP